MPRSSNSDRSGWLPETGWNAEAPKKSWKREELAWAAGFFDGEGTIGVTLANDYLILRLIVGQARIAPLKRLKVLFGFGKIRFAHYKHNDDFKRKVRLFWDVAKFEQIQFVVAALWPWLCQPKKDQAIEALKKYIAPYRSGSRKSYVSRSNIHKSVRRFNATQPNEKTEVRSNG